MTPAPVGTRRARLARAGLFGTALALALVLVAAAVIAWRGARARVELVDRGQGGRYFQAYLQRFPPPLGPPSSRALEAFLRTYEGDGLRAVALVQMSGEPLVLAGRPAVASWERDLERGPSFRRVRGRVRVAHPLVRGPEGLPGMFPGGPPPDLVPGGPSPGHFPGPFGRPPPFGPRPGMLGGPPMGGPPMRGGLPGGGPLRLVLEFEPVASARLLDGAARSLQLALGVAAVMALVSVLFWRQLVRSEALRARYDRQERLAALGMMSAVVAHEIRNPLAALKGHAQLLAEAVGEDARARPRADRVVDAAERLEALVTDLLEFVREGPLAREDVDPAELLHGVVTDLAPDAALDLDAAPPRWSLDPSRVRRALTNLVENALHAGPADKVAAAVLVEDGALVFTVRDGGPGVPVESREQIFEPFYTTKARGVGLGLALVRRVATLHGGSASVRPAPGGGSEFRLVLQ